jgi:hypothetical protein
MFGISRPFVLSVVPDLCPMIFQLLPVLALDALPGLAGFPSYRACPGWATLARSRHPLPISAKAWL